jgi:acetyl-CoA C-acetyltransferase
MGSPTTPCATTCRLAGLHPTAVLGATLKEVIARAGIDAGDVEQVVGGCVTQAGEQGNNITRYTWLAEPPARPRRLHDRRLPVRLGPAGQPLHRGPDHHRRHRHRHRLRCRDDERVGLGANVLNGPGVPRPDDWDVDLPDQFVGCRADRHGSWDHAPGRRRARAPVQNNAKRAWDEGRFDREDLRDRGARARRRGQADRRDPHRHPRPGPPRDHRRGPRSLKPVIPDGVHTAGNSSQISDGAAAVLWMSRDKAEALGLRPAPASSPRRWSGPTRTTTSTVPARPRRRCSTRRA